MHARPGGPLRRPGSRARRGAAVVLAGLAALMGLTLAVAPAAAAHVSLLFTTPGVGTSVPDSPKTLTLIFDQPVTLSGKAVRVQAEGGSLVAVGPASRIEGGSVVTARVTQALKPGAYTVTWQVVAQDGDVITGSYQFGVGPGVSGALSAGGLGSSATSGQEATAVLRWTLFAALAVMAGEAAGVLLTRRHRPGMAAPRSWALPAALAGTVAALGLVALIVGDGSLLDAFSHPPGSRLSGRAGVLAVVEAAAFAVAALFAAVRPRRAWAPLVAVVVAEGIRAHPQAFQPGWGAPVTMVHVAAAAVWIGALLYVGRCMTAWRAVPGAAWGALGSYAWLAGWLFGTVVTTGVLSALIVVPLHAWTTGYAVLLLAKLALVGGVAASALTARGRLRRRAGRGRTLRWMRMESGLLAGVLVLAATLTAAAPPRQVSGALPVAPPPSGLVVPLGTRTGQIGVNVQASAGQVVIRLTAPGSDAPGADAGYRLAATLAPPTGPGGGLRLRTCGTGCFVAPVTWRPGTSRLTLRADSRDWEGGTASLSVPWPARDGSQALRHTTEVLRGTGKFTLYERVTSDTAAGQGTPHSLPLTGNAFLNSEPYSGSRATYADLVPGPAGTATLLLGYPTENVQVELVLDATGRPERETLTDPNHLSARTFIYSDDGGR